MIDQSALPSSVPLARPRAHEVQLWQFQLDVAAAERVALLQYLSPDERRRAERLRIPLVRERFVVARGLLRAALARYTDLAPAALCFRYGPTGKPYLDHPSGAALSFNLAHSHQRALLAVAGGVPVGVDLERIADADYVTIAQRFFAAAELQAFAALPPAQQRTAFYRAWVCKEAFVKAHDAGPALDQFAVSVTPDAPAALLYVADDPDATAHWRLVASAPVDGFVAALCIAGSAANPLQISYHYLMRDPAGERR